MSVWSKIKGGLKSLASAPLKLIGGAVKLPAQAVSALGGTAGHVLRAASDTARQVLPQLVQAAASAAPVIGGVMGGPLGAGIGQVISGLGAGDRVALGNQILSTAGQLVDPTRQAYDELRQLQGQLPIIL
jgi:hypothetical protein